MSRKALEFSIVEFHNFESEEDWNSYIIKKLRAAGFRVKPFAEYIAQKPEDVLYPPFQVTENPVLPHRILIEQWDTNEEVPGYHKDKSDALRSVVKQRFKQFVNALLRR